jgi:acyl transferase domain-containing protein
MSSSSEYGSAIAIVGMGCRVPGANDVRSYWRNLRDGVESVRTLSREEMEAAGIDPAELLNPKHVPAGALVSDIDMFDAAFFGIPAREAELMDPQHRLFLECAWETLEDAACDPARYDGAISVFGGGIFDSYVTWNLLPAGIFDDKAGTLQTVLANEKDYMTARVAYKLNLRGAACNVQTGCSTSLVAVHLACQSLLNFESDMALAGGVAVDVARRKGYHYHEGSVFSPDGHCRAFDADAKGTVFGNGVAIVALKRLEDAIAAGDTIRAIIRGTAINNDGSLKVGFTAPSVNGQSQVIAEALAAAGVGPETIGYVETHGTGTALGDPIEIQAMARAFAGASLPAGRCAIGSVKTNIGHLDAAAGTASLIKTVLALQHREIPPTLHFRQPNPELHIHDTPFTVVTEPRPWTTGTQPGVPRRAGVSSFGIGGTNAHAIVEEAPVAPPTDDARRAQLLVLSARSSKALDGQSSRLAEHLHTRPDVPLADVAFTLQTGRALFARRRAIVCRDHEEAIRLLETPAAPAQVHAFDGTPARTAFVFPGQGAQYPGMARRLYEIEPVFRREFDVCAAALPGVDLTRIVRGDADAAAVTSTATAQPALFAVEYALAQLWRHWGVEPAAMLGHSIGEYVAACLAGVFSPADGIRLVAERGRLMQQMPAGAMTAVPLPEDRIQLPPGSGLDIAAVNGPALTVVAGSLDAIDRFERAQRSAGIECRRLHTSHAFHSAAMDPVVQQFAERVSAVRLDTPSVRFLSNVTGTWITDDQATSPAYWARHLRAPVLFGAGLATLLEDGVDLLVEAGPGRTLGALARSQRPSVAVASSLPGPAEAIDDDVVLLEGLGRAWLRGVAVNWKAFYADEKRRRVELPTYAFDHERHWIEPDLEEVERRRARVRANEKRPGVKNWFYTPCWRQTTPSGCASLEVPDANWLVFSDGSEVAGQIVAALEERAGAARVVVATPAVNFGRSTERHYGYNPASDADYDLLVAAVARRGGGLRIAYLGLAGPDARPVLERTFFGVARVGGALARVAPGEVTVKVVTAGVDAVVGTETLVPEAATIKGACLALAQEQRQARCLRIDVAAGSSGLSAVDTNALLAELLADGSDPQVAIRAGRRWVPTVEPIEGEPSHPVPIRPEGHYLIVGGLGTIGFTLAWHVAVANPRLTVVGRTPLPPRDEWRRWIDTHPAGDPVSARIQRVAALEKRGATVLTVAADAADAAAMRTAVERAESTFGPLHGVITAAGLMDESSFAPLDRLDADRVRSHMRPKLEGLPALASAIGTRPIDFCVVTSSLSSLLGGVGYAAYAGANAFLDAFVQQRVAAGDTRWAVINWDAWHPLEGEMPATSLLARLALKPAEGAQAFDLILKLRRAPQILVSTADLAARLGVQTDVRAPVEETVDAVVDAPAAADEVHQAALTATERTIVGIWQDVLGIRNIQVHDSFLDLGGSSLTAIQVIGRIDEQLGVKVVIEEFIFQTAGQLAALCDGRSAAVKEPAPVAEPPAAAPATGGRGWARLRQALRTPDAREVGT